MASLRNRMESTLHNMYRQGKGVPKAQDPQHRYIHSRRTLKTYLQQVSLYADWLRTQGVKSRAKEEEAVAHIQAYLDDLTAQGKSPHTVHTAAAAVCKALGESMGDYDKPLRDSAPRKGREAAASMAGRHDGNMDDARYCRLVSFARVVGLRRAEYAQLRGRDLVCKDGRYYVHVLHGKGGREQWQLIDDDDVPIVKECFAGIGSDELVFSPEDMRNKLNLHLFRREQAQEMYSRYMARMEEDSAYREELIRDLKQAFAGAGKDWRRSKDMRLLDTPYFTRRAIRRDMRTNDRPLRYDRVALMAVSVFHLAHWRADVTVSNYMR